MGSLQTNKQKIDRRGEGRSLEQALKTHLTMKNASESCRGAFQKEDHIEIKNLMEPEMKILISEGMVEVEENAVKDIQIGGVWSFCKECGHFASDCSQYKFEGKNVNFAKEESDSEDPALLLACGKFDGSNSNT